MKAIIIFIIWLSACAYIYTFGDWYVFASLFLVGLLVIHNKIEPEV